MYIPKQPYSSYSTHLQAVLPELVVLLVRPPAQRGREGPGLGEEGGVAVAGGTGHGAHGLRG